MTKKDINFRHIWSVLCTNSSIDQQTNNVSLYNVIEQIHIDKAAFEAVTKNPEEVVVANIVFEIVSLWKKDESAEDLKVEQRLDMLDPTGKLLDSVKNEFKIPAKVTRFRFKLQINGMKVTAPGEYNYVLNVKNPATGEFDEVTRVPLEVKEQK